METNSVYAIFTGSVDEQIEHPPIRPLWRNYKQARKHILNMIEQEVLAASEAGEVGTTWVEEDGNYWTNGMEYFKLVKYQVQ